MLVFAPSRSSESGNAFLFTVNVAIGPIPLKNLSENKSVPDFVPDGLLAASSGHWAVPPNKINQ
jgi:hypothetical protein